MNAGGRPAIAGGPLCLLLAAILPLAACREGEAPTAEQNRQMDEAAELLNQAPATLEAVDDGGLAGAANDGSGAAPPP